LKKGEIWIGILIVVVLIIELFSKGIEVEYENVICA